MGVFAQALASIADEGSCALVTVVETKGSAPRESGARMVVRPSGGFHGTIGGGALEWRALSAARRLLERGVPVTQTDSYALGPGLGQCCGGRVSIRTETFSFRDNQQIAALAAKERDGPFKVALSFGADGRPNRRILGHQERHDQMTLGETVEVFGEVLQHLLLFGAGHVGRALVLALGPLPFAVRWIDPRQDAFPSKTPANVTPIWSARPDSELYAAPDDALALVMTHSHPLDFEIVACALRDCRFPYVGLIGSGTKRAKFDARLRSLGVPDRRMEAFVCPIGLPGIIDKSPSVIAAACAAQLLLIRDGLRARPLRSVQQSHEAEVISAC